MESTSQRHLYHAGNNSSRIIVLKRIISNKCQDKSIDKAYRTVCDKCAQKDGLCSKCGQSKTIMDVPQYPHF